MLGYGLVRVEDYVWHVTDVGSSLLSLTQVERRKKEDKEEIEIENPSKFFGEDQYLRWIMAAGFISHDGQRLYLTPIQKKRFETLRPPPKPRRTRRKYQSEQERREVRKSKVREAVRRFRAKHSSNQ
jgi:hypothetical protein